MQLLQYLVPSGQYRQQSNLMNYYLHVAGFGKKSMVIMDFKSLAEMETASSCQPQVVTQKEKLNTRINLAITGHANAPLLCFPEAYRSLKKARAMLKMDILLMGEVLEPSMIMKPFAINYCNH